MSAITKGIYIILGMAITVPLSAVLSAPELSYVVSEQEDARKWTGEYFSDVSDPFYTINTYETVCRGYVIRQETESEVQYIGYGDLADRYTYTELKESKLTLATTTDPKFDSASSTDIGLQPNSPLEM